MNVSTTPDARRRIPRWRKWLLGMVVVVALCGGLGYRYFWLYHPVGSGPAGPQVPREPFTRLWTDRPVLLVGLGDSVTAGYGASPGKSFFHRLLENPPDEFRDLQGINLKRVCPNLTSVNLALSGSTSIECLEIILPKLEVQPRDTFGIVVMTTGGNDIIHMYGRTPPREGAMYGATWEQAEPWIARFDVRLNAILDETKSRFPGGCRVFLANIYDPTDGVGDAENAGLPAWPDGLKVLSVHNDIIARAARKRPEVVLVDMHGLFLGHGIHSLKFWHPHYHPEDTGYWYYDNLEDPNDRGYDALRRAFLIEMAKELPGRMGDVDGRGEAETGRPGDLQGSP